LRTLKRVPSTFAERNIDKYGTEWTLHHSRHTFTLAHIRAVPNNHQLYVFEEQTGR
jgi:hypothetical protein